LLSYITEVLSKISFNNTLKSQLNATYVTTVLKTLKRSLSPECLTGLSSALSKGRGEGCVDDKYGGFLDRWMDYLRVVMEAYEILDKQTGKRTTPDTHNACASTARKDDGWGLDMAVRLTFIHPSSMSMISSTEYGDDVGMVIEGSKAAGEIINGGDGEWVEGYGCGLKVFFDCFKVWKHYSYQRWVMGLSYNDCGYGVDEGWSEGGGRCFVGREEEVEFELLCRGFGKGPLEDGDFEGIWEGIKNCKGGDKGAREVYRNAVVGKGGGGVGMGKDVWLKVPIKRLKIITQFQNSHTSSLLAGDEMALGEAAAFWYNVLGVWYEFNGDVKRSRGCFEKGGNKRGAGRVTEEANGDVWNEWRYGEGEWKARAGWKIVTEFGGRVEGDEFGDVGGEVRGRRGQRSEAA